MKTATLRTTKWNRRVQFRVKEDATLQETVNAVDETADIWSAPEALVAIHAGLNDLSQLGACPEQSVSALRCSLLSWHERAGKHSFLIYAVPEPTQGNTPLADKCRLQN